MRLPKRPRILPFLNLVKFLLVLLMVVMFIQFNARIAQQQTTTRNIAQSTNNVVRGQADILKAIKAVTDDTHTTAAQQTAIIICMLQVPVSSRTTDLQAQCRTQANSVSGDGSVSGTSNNAPSTSQSSAAQSVPSTQSTPTPQPAQPNNVQPAPQRTTIQRVEDTTAKVVDFLWPFN